MSTGRSCCSSAEGNESGTRPNRNYPRIVACQSFAADPQADIKLIIVTIETSLLGSFALSLLMHPNPTSQRCHCPRPEQLPIASIHLKNINELIHVTFVNSKISALFPSHAMIQSLLHFKRIWNNSALLKRKKNNLFLGAASKTPKRSMV